MGFGSKAGKAAWSWSVGGLNGRQWGEGFVLEAGWAPPLGAGVCTRVHPNSLGESPEHASGNSDFWAALQVVFD